jgi:predicted esterase
MKRGRMSKKIFLWFLPVIPLLVLAGPQQLIERGTVLEKIICKEDSQQSYALYLPSSYSPDKKWPIIFAFDPGARGSYPVTCFKQAAEKYNYIIVGSNNSRNGPWEIAFKAMKAMWKDVQQRLAVDFKRVYTTGFSGGSRTAALFSVVTRAEVAGIIACGAGLPPNFKAHQVKPASYYGAVGLRDFNYKEFVKLRDQLDEAGVHHFIEVFGGSHTWPPEDVCTSAVEWLEITAIRQKTRPRDQALIDSVYENMLAKSEKLIDTGYVYYGVDLLKLIATDFMWFKDVAEINQKIKILENSLDYKAFALAEDDRNQKEQNYIYRFAVVFSKIKKEPLQRRINLKSIFNNLLLDKLNKEALNKKNIFESALAERLLVELWIKSREEGHSFLRKKDYSRSVVFFEIAAKANNRSPNILYNLACAYSLNNQKKPALRNLRLAVEKGFKDLSILKRDKDLDPIRNDKEFHEIIKNLEER